MTPGEERLLRAESDPEAALVAVVEELGSRPGVQLRRDEPLARHLPLRSGGPADLWIEVDDLDALKEALRVARQHNVSWSLCWPFEDRLVRDGGIRGAALRPGRGFERLRLLPADAHGPARIELGAAAPWAAVAACAPDPSSPPAEVGTWPGCPGGNLPEARLGLEGLLWAVTWFRGRSVERTELPQGAVPPDVPKSAVLLSVEVPLAWPAGARRLKHRHRPPPPGTLFSAEEGLDIARQLALAGILGSRLRAWRMAHAEPGTLVAIAPGDTRSALLFAKGIADHVRKSRGVELQQRLSVDGVDGPPASRTGPPARPKESR